MECFLTRSNESLSRAVKDKVTQALCLDIRNEESLQSVGVEDMDTVIVAMGESFEQSILITALLKKRLNIPYVIARSTYAIHDDILKLVGADKVVLPERYVGKRMAINLSLPFVELINITDTFSMTQLRAPKNFIGKTIAELELRKKNRIACMAIKKGKDIILVDPDYVIMENDVMLLSGENKHLAAMVHLS